MDLDRHGCDHPPDHCVACGRSEWHEWQGAPHFIGFRFQAGQQHGGGLGWALGMQFIGAGRKAFHQKMQELRETDADGTADPTEGDALTQQLFDASTLGRRNTPFQGIRRKLAATCFTLVILLPMTGMTILLVPVRSTGWACISDDHGGC